MPYMHGVLNEVLRLLPAEPGGNQRTTPPEGHTINGEFIRGNTQVGFPEFPARIWTPV
jgi:hypothetical protein